MNDSVSKVFSFSLYVLKNLGTSKKFFFILTTEDSFLLYGAFSEKKKIFY